MDIDNKWVFKIKRKKNNIFDEPFSYKLRKDKETIKIKNKEIFFNIQIESKTMNHIMDLCINNGKDGIILFKYEDNFKNNKFVNFNKDESYFNNCNIIEELGILCFKECQENTDTNKFYTSYFKYIENSNFIKIRNTQINNKIYIDYIKYKYVKYIIRVNKNNSLTYMINSPELHYEIQKIKKPNKIISNNIIQ